MITGGAVVTDDHTTTSAFTKFRHSLLLSYQHVLEKSKPLCLYRWIFLSALAFLYALRVYRIKGFCRITYVLGFHILYILIDFLLVLRLHIRGSTNGPSLPTRGSDEFRPFVHRFPEFKFWLSLSNAFCIASLMTLFSAVYVPVLCSILPFYWLYRSSMEMRKKYMVIRKQKWLDFGQTGVYTLRAYKLLHQAQTATGAHDDETSTSSLVDVITPIEGSSLKYLDDV